MSTPIERLRKLHEQDCNCMCTCGECNLPETPCDLIAALDALEGQIDHLFERRELDKAYAAEMAAREQSRKLQARIDAATVLLNEALWLVGEGAYGDDVRAWLAGDKEEHGE